MIHIYSVFVMLQKYIYSIEMASEMHSYSGEPCASAVMPTFIISYNFAGRFNINHWDASNMCN